MVYYNNILDYNNMVYFSLGGIDLYLYLLNRPSNHEELAHLECLMLTGAKTEKCYAISNNYIDIRNSAFLDICVDIFFTEEKLDILYERIRSLNFDEENYRVKFINIDIHIDFSTRKALERHISDIFTGAPDLINPDSEFIITNLEGKWLFGKTQGYAENRWLKFNKKPHTFCNSLSSRMSRALVNIAVQNHKGLKLLDPCCGMGSIILEALDMGIDAYGFDINRTVVRSAKKNLQHFGFEDRILLKDASTIEGCYDVSIVDLPYAIMSTIDKDEYYDILGNLRKVCDKSIILCGEDISDVISHCGFNIENSCKVKKGNLTRHISVCL